MRFSNLSAGLFWVVSGGLLIGQGDLTNAADPPTEAAKKPADPLFPITISKETTRITEPLKPDGTPDYAAALNARLSEGVTPENNAAAILIPVIGVNQIPKESRDAFFKTLGVPPLAEPAGRVRDFWNMIEARTKEQTEQSKLWDQQSAAMRRPWSRQEFPLVAEWIDANAEPLRITHESTQKPRFFLPYVVGVKETLVNASMSHSLTQLRNLARLLNARAMLAIGEGRTRDAQADLLACHRLASLLGQQLTLIEALVAIAMDNVASEGDLLLAQSKHVTAKQLAAYRKQLASLPPLPKISRTIDRGERLVSLDAICNLATQQDEAAAQAMGLLNNKVFMKMMGLSIDWDLILKRFNAQYDKLVAALESPTFAERKAEIAKIDQELKELREEVNKPAQFALMFLGVDPPRAVVSRQVGNVLFALLIPAVEQSAEAETRAYTRRDLTIIALALAEYRLDNGEYPDKLQDLSPKYLKTIPNDRFTDQPLKYQKEETGYLLYSLGPNGQDDKGQTRGETQTSDDQAIRVPERPEL